MRWFIKLENYNGPGKDSYTDWGGFKTTTDLNKAFKALEKIQNYSGCLLSWAPYCVVEEYTNQIFNGKPLIE